MVNKFNYDRPKATATRLIEKFGQIGQLMQYAKDDSGHVTYSPTPIKMVILDYKVNQIDGTRIQANDRMIYVAADGATPTIKDRIEDAGGKVYQIIPPVNVLNPGGTLVFTQVQARA